jgi:hypothetical protein
MEEGAPFNDLTNIPANRASGTTSIAHDNFKKKLIPVKENGMPDYLMRRKLNT